MGTQICTQTDHAQLISHEVKITKPFILSGPPTLHKLTPIANLMLQPDSPVFVRDSILAQEQQIQHNRDKQDSQSMKVIAKSHIKAAEGSVDQSVDLSLTPELGQPWINRSDKEIKDSNQSSIRSILKKNTFKKQLSVSPILKKSHIQQLSSQDSYKSNKKVKFHNVPHQVPPSTFRKGNS